MKHDSSAHIGDWNGMRIRATSRLIPRFFWQTASIDVYIDERCVLRTGGQLKLVGGTTASFNHGGSTHLVQLSWGRGSVRSFPIETRIDGLLISKTRVITGNWPLAFWPWAVALGILIWQAGKR